MVKCESVNFGRNDGTSSDFLPELSGRSAEFEDKKAQRFRKGAACDEKKKNEYT
ncbi:hypothetical protein [Rubritalea tangerina]|uniref:hypothetical protein n=1 Tax=Rubritalea tangerina TaxID=430798 RepID=UPI003612294C